MRLLDEIGALSEAMLCPRNSGTAAGCRWDPSYRLGVNLVRRSWPRGVLAAAVVVFGGATSSTSMAAPAFDRFDRDGIAFSYPSSWFVTTRPLRTGVDPEYVFTVSTAPVRRTPDDLGPCTPGVAGQLRENGVLAYVREALDSRVPEYIDRMQPRPPSLQADHSLCGFPRGGRWVPFRSGGRAFYLGLYVGK